MKGKQLGAIFLAAAMLTGCGGTELSKEQSALVAQYAAGLLLKYDRNYNDKLLTDEEIAAAEEAERLAAEKQAELEKIREEMKNPSKTDTSEDNNSQEQEAEEPKVAMNDILKVSGFDIQYVGYELLEAYPPAEKDANSEDVYFSLNAAPGKKLLTLRFRVTNKGEQAAKISLLDKEMLCKLVMPDGSKKNAMMTMLLNDLAFYEEEFQAGESKEAVIIFDIKEDTKLEKFDLSVVIGENAYMVAL